MLASFVRFVLKFEAGSANLPPGEAAQFVDIRVQADEPVLGYYLQNVFEMKDYNGAFTERERGLFGCHYVNITGDNLDTDWTTEDYESVESAVQNWWQTMSTSIPTFCRLVEHRWYAFGALTFPPNPPARVTILSPPKNGSGGVNSAPQIAVTATLRTALRKHWGRMYLPLGTFILNTHGQNSPAGVDAVASAVRTMLKGPEDSQGITPVVWDRTRKLAYGVTALEVDSVPDIIRRRRPRDTGYRKIITA